MGLHGCVTSDKVCVSLSESDQQEVENILRLLLLQIKYQQRTHFFFIISEFLELRYAVRLDSMIFFVFQTDLKKTTYLCHEFFSCCLKYLFYLLQINRCILIKKPGFKAYQLEQFTQFICSLIRLLLFMSKCKMLEPTLMNSSVCVHQRKNVYTITLEVLCNCVYRCVCVKLLRLICGSVFARTGTNSNYVNLMIFTCPSGLSSSATNHAILQLLTTPCCSY